MDASRRNRLRYHLQSRPRQQSFESLDAAAIRRYGDNIHNSFRKLVIGRWFCPSSKVPRSISAAATSHFEITSTNHLFNELRIWCRQLLGPSMFPHLFLLIRQDTQRGTWLSCTQQYKS